MNIYRLNQLFVSSQQDVMMLCDFFVVMLRKI